jgi:hypothetical protein
VRTESYIRSAELGVTLASTYMVAVTMLQTSIYYKLTPYILMVFGPLLTSFGADPAFLDMVILGLVVALSFSFWRRGDEAGFGRLFSLNMLMFFPSVIDFSMFNWVNLILPYEPAPSVPHLWVFGVGLLLQGTYLFLRYTVRFRMLRGELEERGAEPVDVDEVSRGQMFYLSTLVVGTGAISAVVYYMVPVVMGLVNIRSYRIPFPHVVIGVVCTILIAAATILYLRSGGGGEILVFDVLKSEESPNGDSTNPT